jgi:SAM-dependent methyltransferase
METILCPLCGSKHNTRLFAHKDFTYQTDEEVFAVVRCNACGMVYLNPRPDENEMARYYPEEFYQTTQTAAGVFADKVERLAAKWKMVKELPIGRALDVGCGKGEFLFLLQRNGWEVEGLEFSPTPANLFDLPIRRGTLDQAAFANESFDLVTLWAVFEHLHHPKKYLSEIKRILRPGGRCMILIPNFRSLPGWWMQHDDIPRHLLMFTEKTFDRMATEAGFGVTKTTFSDDIFSGSHRGALNYLCKRLGGERLEEIVAQNRTPGRWNEFSGELNGKPSKLLAQIDRIDQRLTPKIDALARLARRSFIMIKEIQPLGQK